MGDDQNLLDKVHCSTKCTCTVMNMIGLCGNNTKSRYEKGDVDVNVSGYFMQMIACFLLGMNVSAVVS